MSKLSKAGIILAAFMGATAFLAPVILKPKAEPQTMLINGKNISEASVIVGQSGVEISCNNDTKVTFNSTSKPNIQEAACGQITKRLICRMGENLDKIRMQHIIFGEMIGARTVSLAVCVGPEPDAPSSTVQKPSAPAGVRL